MQQDVKTGNDRNYREEMRSAYLYRQLSELEKGSSREKLFSSLADAAERQAKIWAPSGATYRPDLRTRWVAFLLSIFGPERMLSALAAMKIRGISVYSSHDHYVAGAAGTFHERRHRSRSTGGNLRAAVFGANDGLLSNASLMLGVAGSSADTHTILISGAAGLLAGAFSMAAGEFVSVTSQRELYEYQIGLERDELEEYPEEEAAELALIYEAKGVSPEDASRMSKAIIADPERALDSLAREELGLNPDDLGSPWGAAISSFLSFAAGAFVPLFPLILHLELDASLIATACALFLLGCALSLFTGKKAWLGGIRMLAIGLLASGVTWTLGRVLGAALH